jgi:hypothetical protein
VLSRVVADKLADIRPVFVSETRKFYNGFLPLARKLFARRLHGIACKLSNEAEGLDSYADEALSLRKRFGKLSQAKPGGQRQAASSNKLKRRPNL